MFTPDILSLLIGTVVGGVLKIIAKRMEARKAELNLLMQRQGLADDSADRAGVRGGPITRRIIALIVISYLFVAPVLIQLFRPELAIIYAYPESVRGFLWFAGPESLKFVEVTGFVMLPFQRHLAEMIAGFYFGAGIVK